MRNWDKEYILEDLLKENIISLDRGRVISSVDLVKYPGVFPVYSSSSQKNGLFGCYDKFDFDEELITWSVDGGGYFFYRPKHKFSVTNVSGVLKVNKPELFDYKFLYYNLAFQHASQYYDYSDKAHPSVIKKQYLIPKIDLEEQQKIASILSKLDEAITQTEQLIVKYKKIKEGLMHDLLTRGIDEQGNIRSEETHKFKDSPLGRIPEEWGIKCLNDCIDTSTTITYGIVQTFEHIENGVPVLRTLDLKEDELNPIENLLRTKKKISDSYKRTILKKNDIVCNVRASVGDYNLITDIYENCNTTRGVARICPSKEFDNLYLLRFLQSYINKKQMEFYIKGTTFLDINIADLKKILVLIPDYNEQKRISRSLQAVQDMIKREQNQLSKYILQKSGLMHDLLTGKVRVKI